MNYCEDIYKYKRNNTKIVNIGNIPLGGNNPVRLQSMTNTDTNNIEATIKQCQKIIDNGADYIRLTTQGKKEIDSLIKIQKQLRSKKINTPIIVDVHFNPKIAELAAQHFAKVRINPGNYVDKKRNKVEYAEEEFNSSIEKIKQNIKPLIDICKKNNTAIRIGINHGSLSERIMSKYGDTPEGMVESAMEFLKICKEENFENIVISMKSSNVRIMVQSNRLLVNKMKQEEMNYPIHLGVTEAGQGEDGIIKSAIGIGALLNDGIGDTIRVSLTDDPETEIPVAKKIVDNCTDKSNHDIINNTTVISFNPYSFSKVTTKKIQNIGGKNPPVVISNFAENIAEADYLYIDSPDQIITKKLVNQKIILKYKDWLQFKDKLLYAHPLFDFNEFVNSSLFSDKINFVEIYNKNYNEDFYKKLIKNNVVIILNTDNKNGYADQRAFWNYLLSKKMIVPVIIKRIYNENKLENLQIKSACDIGPLFIDGFGDGIFIENKGNIAPKSIVSTSFSILQGSRAKITKTEYISCPGCGRTLFNLQDAVKKIKQKTLNLKGLKIAVMGCIVNGPGEMADADYGYVGAGNGKVTLYKNKTIQKKNIPENDALDELIALIKENGDWKE